MLGPAPADRAAELADLDRAGAARRRVVATNASIVSASTIVERHAVAASRHRVLRVHVQVRERLDRDPARTCPSPGRARAAARPARGPRRSPPHVDDLDRRRTTCRAPARGSPRAAGAAGCGRPRSSRPAARPSRPAIPRAPRPRGRPGTRGCRRTPRRIGNSRNSIAVTIAEVAAAAAQRPEEVGLALAVDSTQSPVGGHDLDRGHLVGADAVLAAEPREAAAERVADDADVRRGAGERGEAVLAPPRRPRSRSCRLPARAIIDSGSIGDAAQAGAA